MALFKRARSSENESPTLASSYEKVSIREVLTYGFWSESMPCIVHIEVGPRNYLKATTDGEAWQIHEVSTREEGTRIMREIREDAKIANRIGLCPEAYWMQYRANPYGFAEVDFDQALAGNNPDQMFSLGRDLDERIHAGWLPADENGCHLVSSYLINAPLTAGYFGPYKTILKRVTEDLGKISENIETYLVGDLVSSLGFAYGRIEGFASRLNRKAAIAFDWNLSQLATLPEFNGFAYPRIRTLQYLMRKGNRFLSRIELHSDPTYATFFRIYVLWAADMTHYSLPVPEESYLRYQQLVTRIIYGDNKLATRDNESRKVVLAERKRRHNQKVTPTRNGQLNEHEIGLIKSWLENLNGKNSGITHFALALTKAVPELEFPWKESTVGTLFSSESEDVRTEIWKAIKANPSLLRLIPAIELMQVLNSEDTEKIDLILSSVETSAYFFHQLIGMWGAENYVKKKLTPIELKIASTFLMFAWHSISNGTWDDPTPKRDILFFQVAQQTNLDPFDSWKTRAIYIYPGENLLGYYGIEPDAKYERGLLDVLKLDSEDKLFFFAKPIVGNLWGDRLTREKLIEIADAFLGSAKPGASDLIWTLIGKGILPREKNAILLDYLNSQDPSGSVFVRALASAIKVNDRSAVLGYFNLLSSDAYDPMWRRNKSKYEEILMGWKPFPNLIWKSLESMPAKALERVLNFSDFGMKLLKEISPGSIAKMSSIQGEFFVKLIEQNPTALSNSSLVKAMLTAPNGSINAVAAEYVYESKKMPTYWLLMIESNLPNSQNMAVRYLESIKESRDFPDKLLMILDSNNVGARTVGLRILRTVKNPTTLSKIVDSLVENRNSDTWRAVSANLEMISDVEKYQEFTSQVFLSRRKARSVKEAVKKDIEEQIEDIAEALNKDTIIRMAHSSVNRDREWALKQIATQSIELDEVTVEASWGSEFNV